MINLIINGKNIQADEDLTILQAAVKNGVEIPTLCYHPALETEGACRLCTVEVITGKRRRFVTSCNYPVSEGLEVITDSEGVISARKTIVELLYARCPDVGILKDMAEKLDIPEPRYKSTDSRDRCILCGLCVRVCEERMGRSAISMLDRGINMKVGTPFHIEAEACMACGACVTVCPTDAITLEDITNLKPESIPSEFNRGLNNRHPIYLPYPQAVPNVPVIDRDNCIHLKTGKCKICTDVCEAGAIDYEQEDEIVDIEVGSIILAPGFDTFDPDIRGEFGYSRYDNVVTSLEFERILSASGPFEGEIKRLSDDKHPGKVAWIQCVGSRDLSCGNNYCSSVCCMYATKEAIIAKEHDNNIEPTIFYMDIRAFGKDFDLYYERARNEYGIKYVRSMISGLYERPKSKNIIVKYVDEGEGIKEDEFDMVVLSVGMVTSPSTIDLCNRLDIDLDEYNFCKTSAFEPLSTSREGIYVCGSFQSPKDIPETVAQASGAAAFAGGALSPARGELIEDVLYPPERDIEGEELRIGVFVCHCGINIAGVVDVPSVRDYARELPGVVYVDDCIYTCSQDTQKMLKEVIVEQRLNRVVVASCSPRTHEALFQTTIREAGLNKYLFDMANIRDQCSWVHMFEKDKATAKSKDLVRMSVANAGNLLPLQEITLDVNRHGLVIGGGLAGMKAALNLAEQGFEVTLVEKEAELGGNLKKIYTTIQGDDVRKYLSDLINSVESNPMISVIRNAEIDNSEGYKGNFTTSLLIGPTMRAMTIGHGITIVATGAEESKPVEYLYGEDERVLTQMELEEKLALHGDSLKNQKQFVMIQCVGSRNEERAYCSRICCSHAIKNALKIKENNPEAMVYILYRDIRTYGLLEEYYTTAREKGIIFIRYNPENKPEVLVSRGSLKVNIEDPDIKINLELSPDLLILSSAVIPKENEELAGMLKINRNSDRFYLEAHMKLRPVDFATDGIFMAGMAHMPKLIDESITQAAAASARAVTVLSKEKLQSESIVAKVDPELCAVCLTCVRVCPFEVPFINDDSTAEINSLLCQGCGTCVSDCPGKAIELQHYRDVQIAAKFRNILEEVN